MSEWTPNDVAGLVLIHARAMHDGRLSQLDGVTDDQPRGEA